MGLGSSSILYIYIFRKCYPFIKLFLHAGKKSLGCFEAMLGYLIRLTPLSPVRSKGVPLWTLGPCFIGLPDDNIASPILHHPLDVGPLLPVLWRQSRANPSDQLGPNARLTPDKPPHFLLPFPSILRYFRLNPPIYINPRKTYGHHPTHMSPNSMPLLTHSLIDQRAAKTSRRTRLIFYHDHTTGSVWVHK